MPKEKIVAGLDIGSSKVACVIAKKTRSEIPKIIGIGSAPCRGLNKGSVVSMKETVKAIEEAVDAAEVMAEENVEEVVVGIKGPHVSSINHHAAINIMRPDNEVTQDDIDQLMSSAKAVMVPGDREIIHTIPQGFAVDEQKDIEEPIGLQGSHLAVDVHIVTGAVSRINNLKKCVAEAGFYCREVVSSILAAGEILASPDERRIGCVLVDMGAQTTDIAIYSDQSIRYISEIGIGGDDVTDGIAPLLRASPSSAKELKEKYGSAYMPLVDPKEEITYTSIDGRTQKTVSRKHLCEKIIPRVRKIHDFVGNEIEISPYNDMISSGIILTGGASQLLGMQEACEEYLKMPVTMGIPRYVEGSMDGITDPAFACAVGLVKADFSGLEKFIGYNAKKSGLLAKLKKFLEDAI